MQDQEPKKEPPKEIWEQLDMTQEEFDEHVAQVVLPYIYSSRNVSSTAAQRTLIEKLAAEMEW